MQVLKSFVDEEESNSEFLFELKYRRILHTFESTDTFGEVRRHLEHLFKRKLHNFVMDIEVGISLLKRNSLMCIRLGNASTSTNHIKMI